MDIHFVTFKRPPLLELNQSTIGLEDSSEDSMDAHLRELLRSNEETHVNVVVVRTDKSRALYAATNGQSKRLDVTSLSDPLLISFVRPGTGRGSITIGKKLEQPLFRFGQVYGMFELEQARFVAKKLHSPVGYQLEEVCLGVDA